ncbi:MAG: hypothetical protein R2690_10215 [Acidimicrobiales bacterium]
MPDDVARAGEEEGKANMSANVPALPNQVTSTGLAPSASKVTVMPATMTSRASTMIENHCGAPPTQMMPPMPTKNRMRSAVGSMSLPRLETWLKWRAM